MHTIPETKLKLRTQVPVFQLMSAEGRPVNLWDFKGRKNMVIAFFPGEIGPACMDFLNIVSHSYHQYEGEDAVFLAVLQGGQDKAIGLYDELHPPFPILYDADGGVTRRYTNIVPAVFATDRFGELWAEWIIGPEGAFPSQKDIIDVLDLINLECPECGAPLEWT